MMDSLPPHYQATLPLYLKDVNEYLSKHAWIFNYQVTHYLSSKVWEKIPAEWIDPLLQLSIEELNELPYNFSKETWPDSLKLFLKQSADLSLPRTRSDEYASVDVMKSIRRGMIPKKMHEVSSLAAVIDDVCQRCSCQGVVDVGAGLGYLGQVLSQQLNRNVIGLELKDSHTKGAEVRQSKQGTDSKIKLYTMKLTDSKESRETLQLILKNESKIYHEKDSGWAKMTKNLSDVNINDFSNVCSKCEHVELSNSGAINCANALWSALHSANLENESNPGALATCANPFQGAQHSVKSDCEMLSNNGAETALQSSEHSSNSDCESNSGAVTSRTNAHQGALQSANYQCGSHSANSDCGSNPGAMTSSANFDFEPKCGATDSTTKVAHSAKSGSHANALQHSTNLECSSTNLEGCVNICSNNSGFLNGFCMAGLHCCGDLTPTMLKLFYDIPELTCLVCVSCCYHNMCRTDDGRFVNFPMSSAMKDIVPTSGGAPWCDLYAFRLAAQETRARWKNQNAEAHDQHVRHVAYRAVLEELAKSGDCKLKKIKRKVARKTAFKDFDTYLDAVLDRVEGVEVKPQRQQLWEIYHQYEHAFKFIEPVTALQVVLQPVIETLITVDRALYLQECGTTVEVIPIFDELTSPRNLAIIAKKL